MGKGSAKIEVTEYFMSEHFGICHAEPDALLSLTVKEKTAWSGEQTTLGAISIDQSELFGGVKKEGGLQGTVHYLPGAADQVLPDELAQKLGRANGLDCPGFRGLASLFFYGSGRGFYWTANTPYLPGVWARLQRIFKRSDGSAQWYSAKAAISRTVESSSPVATYTFDLDAVSDGGTTAAAIVALGNSITVGSALDIVKITLNHAGSHVALSPWGVPAYSGGNTGSAVRVSVVKDSAGNGFTNYDSSNIHCNGYAAARDLWETDHPNGVSTSGGTTYYFGIQDSPIGDNSGGVSITVEVYSGGFYDMNPAHIIHELLTDTLWGMGTPIAALDDAAFRSAADALYAESFGLSLLWTRQTSIQDFVQEILDHIQGVIYVDPATGLLTLSLIRGDYDADTLDVLDPDNADLSSFGRKLWGDIVNEIVVTWTNPTNEQEETITVQDDASIAIQGGIVSDSRNYYGVRYAALAQDLAYRDLRSAGQPLATCQAEVDRSQWSLRPASVVKLTWPEYGLSELVMRVQSIDYGKPGDPTIKLSLIEDVFGLDIGAYESPPSSSWVDPSAPPEPVDSADVEIFTLPYFFSLGTTIAAFVDSPEYPEVISGVLATSSSDDTFAIELWDEITLSGGSTEWQQISNLNVIGRGELAGEIDPEVATANVTFENITGQTAPELNGFVIIGDAGEAGNEITLISSDAGGDYGLVRGCLDTIPRAWPAGTPVWFVNDNTLFEDSLIRAAGELVDYKLRPRTSQGLLALADAPVESYTLTERPWLPNRPANVTAYGEAWSSAIAPIDARARSDAWVTVTWAIRNRLDEDALILAWDDASATAEVGQTTTIEIRDIDDTLLETHDGLTGTSFDVPDASFGSESIVRLRIYSERSDDDGDFVSLQYFEHWIRVANTALATEQGVGLATESNEALTIEG
jgi:hypothetical protein